MSKDKKNTPLPADKKNLSAEKEKPIPEIGGRGGKDPTRYGDWEKDGRCVDF